MIQRERSATEVKQFKQDQLDIIKRETYSNARPSSLASYYKYGSVLARELPWSSPTSVSIITYSVLRGYESQGCGNEQISLL